MFFRVILAAIIGGALAFVGGFVEHEFLNLQVRVIKQPKSDAAYRESVAANLGGSGVYIVPWLPDNYPTLSKEDQQKAKDARMEQAKQGGAFTSVYSAGDAMDFKKMLIMEGSSDVVAAFIAAMIVAMTRPGLGLVVRWFIVVLIGVFSWVSVNASYHIWWSFPFPWVLDELYCALIEWGLAGIAIAAIVVPRERVAGY
jgi:hypothetical protein